MRIAEIYRSSQGEGLLAGAQSVFVRTSGCNLRCWFCDTPFTSWSPEGEDLAVDAIVAQVTEWDTKHIVVTGGEPMLFAELIPLTAALREMGRHVTIETAGTLYLPVDCDLMSISPKLSNSTPSQALSPGWSRRHERTRYRPDVIRRLISEYEYQLKFVIENREDCGEVEEYLGAFPEVEARRVLLMPQGTDLDTLEEKRGWIEPICLEHGWQFCPRLHIQWFGLVRGS